MTDTPATPAADTLRDEIEQTIRDGLTTARNGMNAKDENSKPGVKMAELTSLLGVAVKWWSVTRGGEPAPTGPVRGSALRDGED